MKMLLLSVLTGVLFMNSGHAFSFFKKKKKKKVPAEEHTYETISDRPEEPIYETIRDPRTNPLPLTPDQMKYRGGRVKVKKKTRGGIPQEFTDKEEVYETIQAPTATKPALPPRNYNEEQGRKNKLKKRGKIPSWGN